MEGLWILLSQEQNILYFQLSVEKTSCQWDERDEVLTEFRSKLYHGWTLHLFYLLERRISLSLDC